MTTTPDNCYCVRACVDGWSQLPYSVQQTILIVSNFSAGYIISWGSLIRPTESYEFGKEATPHNLIPRQQPYQAAAKGQVCKALETHRN